MIDPQVFLLLKATHPFRNLDDSRLAEICRKVQVQDVPQGEILYEEGDDPDSFFIVFSGKIRLTRTIGHDDEEEESLGLLEEGTLFGFEALYPLQPYHLTASAEEDSQVILLDAAWLNDDYLPQLPELHHALDMLRNSYFLSLHVRADWREADESIQYITRRHPFFLFLRLTIPVFVSLILVSILLYLYAFVLPGLVFLSSLIIIILICTFIVLVWNFIDERNDYAILTSQRAIYLQTVILTYESLQETPLDAIVSDKVDTSLLGRSLHYGSVVIRTYTGSIIFPRMSHPEEILSLLQDLRNRTLKQQKKQQKHVLEEMMQSRIYPQPEKEPLLPGDEGEEGSVPLEEEEDVQTTIHSGRVPGILNNLFKLRMEDDGVITYRQHWLILLQRTFFPLLANLALLTALVLGASGNTFFSQPTVRLILFILEIIAFGWWAYQYQDWANDKFIITDTQIIDVYKKPLGTEQRAAAPIGNILSIESSRRGLIGLIFNFGSVFIRVGDEELIFENVVNPSDVQRELFQHLAETKLREKERSDQEEQQRIAEIVTAYHAVTHKKT
jgi:hypothetical protein